MNSNEFMKNNPELVQRAKKCKTREDFITLTEANGIKFDDITLDRAYDFLCGDGTLSEDALESVAGGKGGETLKRIDSPEERAALRSLGYTVIKDVSSGKYFVRR